MLRYVACAWMAGWAALSLPLPSSAAAGDTVTAATAAAATARRLPMKNVGRRHSAPLTSLDGETPARGIHLKEVIGGTQQQTMQQKDGFPIKNVGNDGRVGHPAVGATTDAVATAVATVAATATVATTAVATTDTAAGASTIRWLPWGAGAFERAHAEDKLILLDLTAVWCHACHVMESATYRDPRVAGLLNDGFIPVRVDADQRPDITARYKHGGWPTTGILLPSGEIVFQANFLTSDEIIDALRAAETAYRDNKQVMTERAARVWARVESAQRARAPRRGPIHPAMLDQLLEAMTRQYDRVNGGFGEAPKFFEPAAIALAFARHFRDPRSEYRRMALFTLDRQLKLYDPVWGGFFRYAEEADWSRPHYEKTLDVQAYNLLNYLEAYQSTGLARYRDVVEGTMRYVARFLSDRERGGFYASQDADVRRGGGAGVDADADIDADVPGEEFFALDAARRLAVGVPAVDRTMLTDGNGMMAKAFLKVSQALAHDQPGAFALTTLRRLYKERYQPGRGMAHFLRRGHPRQFGLLTDQVFFADALMEAFVATGERRYLDHAETVMADCISVLEDDQGGGFFDRAPASSALGLLKFPHKDRPVNAVLSTVLSDLFYLTRNPRYREHARNVLRFLVGSAPLPVAPTGRALHRFLHHPVQIVVVGDKASAEAQQLFRRSLAVYVPGKVVRFLDPHVDSLSIGEVTFPVAAGPLAYVCTDTLCSSPVARAEALAEHVRDVSAAMAKSRTPFSKMGDEAASPSP